MEKFFPAPRTREAFVVVQVDLDAVGKVERAEAVDGFFDEQQARAAVEVVNRLKFVPATRDDIPVAAYGVRVPVRFALSGAPKITVSYRNALNEAVRLLNAHQWEAAQHQVDQMVREEVTTAYGYAALQATLGETYFAQNLLFDSLESLRSASTRFEQWVPRYVEGAGQPRNRSMYYMISEPALSGVLRRRMQIEAKLGYAANALSTFAELWGLNALPNIEAYANLARELDRSLKSGQDLVSMVQLNRFGEWQLMPNLRSFTITGLTGGLQSIFVACDQGTRELVYTPGVDWGFPATWEDCQLRFKGTPGTTFQIRFFGT